MTTQQANKISKPLNIWLWAIQAFLAVMFVGAGLWKMLTPVSELAAKMPWMGQVSKNFLYMTAIFDTLGGIGIILPTLTRIKPKVAALAALGCAALQMSAIVFHFSRGEAANTPFNFVLVALSLFVAWGRGLKH